ncbi:MAG: galactokinase [Pyrinomonadaceae bacterium]
MKLERLLASFAEKFAGEPRVFHAPGRVNLIGEHTDYNDGFVLPASLDFATYVAVSVRDDRRIRVASLNFDRELEFDLDQPLQETETTWAKYVQGVGLILEREGFALRGANLLIDSDVPVGAGLSSSAALEISTAFALATLSGHKVDGMKLARIGQAAEHEFAGVRSGIMDQFVSVFGRKNHALFLDCRSMDWEPIPTSSAQFLICNTKTKHELADGEYNKRRAECEAAAAFFGKASLRDVMLEDLVERSEGMPEVPKKRAMHIVTENARVVSSVEALKSGDLAAFGQLMNESHTSMRDDFEISCAELDLMVELARSSGEVLGARMTGGGFGGCTISLMKAGDHTEFVRNVSETYTKETGIVPEIYSCEIGDGVKEVTAK